MGKYSCLDDINICCPHLLDKGIPLGETVPNYKPLWDDDIRDLLFLAWQSTVKEDYRAVKLITRRFVLAVPGMTCWRPSRGLVAERANGLEAYVRNNAHLGPIPASVQEISRLIR